MALTQVRDALASAEAQVLSLEGEREGLSTQTAETASALELARQELGTITTQWHALQEAHAVLQQQHEVSSERVEGLQKQLDTLTTERAELLTQREALQKDRARLSGARETLQQEKTGLEAQVKALEAAAQLAAQQLADLQSQRNDLQQQRETTLAETGRLASQAEASARELVLVTLQLHTVQEELSVLMSLADERQREVRRLEQALSDLQAQPVMAPDPTPAADPQAQEDLDILMQQLHQVQEAYAESYERLQTVDARILQLERERDEAVIGRSVLQQQIESLTGDRQRLATIRDELFKTQRELQASLQAEQAEAKRLQQALAQAQATAVANMPSDDAVVEASELKARNAELQNQLTSLTAQIEQMGVALQAANAQIGASEASAAAQTPDQAGDAALVEALQSERDALAARIERLESRHPHLCDWQAMAPAADESLGLPNEAVLMQQHWHLQGVEHHGRQVPDLTVGLQLGVDGGRRLVVASPADQTVPFRRWPGLDLAAAAAGRAQKPLVVALPLTGTSLLDELSEADFRLLTAVCVTLGESEAVESGEGADDVSWRAMWQDTAQALQHVKPVFRCENVVLKHEQVNPDHEHLRLQCQGVTLGDRAWDRFEFLFSANAVTPEQFAHLPKLEFRASAPGGVLPLQNWLELLKVSGGEGYELRFDTRAPALDVGLWNGLTAEDQDMVLALMGALPAMLRHLAQSGVEVHRPWAQWEAMANDLPRVMQTCLGLRR